VGTGQKSTPDKVLPEHASLGERRNDNHNLSWITKEKL
jgi:hypothetical protein